MKGVHQSSPQFTGPPGWCLPLGLGLGILAVATLATALFHALPALAGKASVSVKTVALNVVPMEPAAGQAGSGHASPPSSGSALGVNAKRTLPPPSGDPGTCLQNVYSLATGKNTTLNCTAKDVSVSKALNIRGLNGLPLSTCQENTTFSFIADFQVLTNATQRENIGMYFGIGGQGTALTGQCGDNIISPLHTPGTSGPATFSDCFQGGGTALCLGTNQYHEFDTSLSNGGLFDNCGDTLSSDSFTYYGDGKVYPGALVTVEMDEVLCKAGTDGIHLALPYCVSWQQPGGAQWCYSNPSYGWPYVSAAIPGAPSKCNCDSGFKVGIEVQKGGITATKTANPLSKPEPGGDFDYTVGVTNTSNFGAITITQVCDDQFGNIATKGVCSNNLSASCSSDTECGTGATCKIPAACPAGLLCADKVDGTTCARNISCTLPQTIPFGQTMSNFCSFTGAVTGFEQTKTDQVALKGVDQNGNSLEPATAQAQVSISEVPATAQTFKSLDSSQECATVRYKVEVDNTSLSTSDESESLQGLTDSAFGNIASGSSALGANVVGTTCGVATTAHGTGTLSGSMGAGTLPATIAVGGKYVCEFDGQFCAALGNKGVNCEAGLESKDTVTAAVLGDEPADVSQNVVSSQLTVDACFTSSSQ